MSQPVQTAVPPRGRSLLDPARELLRVPLRSGHLAYLDGWRGICILLVIAGHFVGPLAPLANVGVEFFFVLSGKLMADLLIFKRQPVDMFLKRRVARVLPAIAVYVLLIGTALNLSLWLKGMPPQWASPAAALFFFHNYLPAGSVDAAFEHTWSLAVEEHSYLALVLIVLAARRRPMIAAGIALLISALAVANAIRLFGLPNDGGQFLFWRSDVRIASVLLSFAMCIVWQRWSESRDPKVGWLPLPAALAAILAIYTEGAVAPLQLLGCTLLAALAVNTMGSSAPTFRSALSAPLLIWFGTLSFSIYVWQQIFYVMHHSGVPALVCVPLLLCCALWSFKRIEDPAREWLNARWSREARARSLAAA